MIKQEAYQMTVAVEPEIRFIFFKAKSETELLTLDKLNKQGKRLAYVFETKDDRQQINRRIAIFEWEEDSK